MDKNFYDFVKKNPDTLIKDKMHNNFVLRRTDLSLQTSVEAPQVEEMETQDSNNAEVDERKEADVSEENPSDDQKTEAENPESKENSYLP